MNLGIDLSLLKMLDKYFSTKGIIVKNLIPTVHSVLFHVAVKGRSPLTLQNFYILISIENGSDNLV